MSSTQIFFFCLGVLIIVSHLAGRPARKNSELDEQAKTAAAAKGTAFAEMLLRKWLSR